MGKIKYTPLFEKWWQAYPRKTAKAVAFRAWQKHADESDAFMCKAMIDNLEKRTRLKWWPLQREKIPHAATWINQGRYLDEGWEDDIKTRGKERTHTPAAPNYTPRIEDDYGLDHWQTMQNRLMRNYIFVHGHLTDAALHALVQTKNDTYAEMRDAIREEVDGATDVAKAKRAMAQLLADTMLSRFDQITGKALRHRVIDAARNERRAAA